MKPTSHHSPLSFGIRGIDFPIVPPPSEVTIDLPVNISPKGEVEEYNRSAQNLPVSYLFVTFFRPMTTSNSPEAFLAIELGSPLICRLMCSNVFCDPGRHS